MANFNTKLTKEIAETILASVRQGNTLGASARSAGVHRATLFRWLSKGRRQREGSFAAFAAKLALAQRKGIMVAVKANPRALRRARTECKQPDHVLQGMAYREMHRVIDEGRVPPDIARDALRMVLDDLDDKLEQAEDRRSWEEIDWRN